MNYTDVSPCNTKRIRLVHLRAIFGCYTIPAQVCWAVDLSGRLLQFVRKIHARVPRQKLENTFKTTSEINPEMTSGGALQRARPMSISDAPVGASRSVVVLEINSSSLGVEPETLGHK